MFRIAFHNNGKVYQLHAKTLGNADVYGFVALEGLQFDKHTSLVVDPSEERLKQEFAGVEQVLIPAHAVIRIDQVKQCGENKIMEFEAMGNVTPFPSPRPQD